MSEEKKIGYPLDWETTEVRLGKGRFRHVLKRPTAEQLITRDNDIQQEIPMAKDGSYSLPDPTSSYKADGELYDLILVTNEGYEMTELSPMHKANAVQALFKKEIELADDVDPLADQVEVVEEIGSGDEPEFVITHTLRQPKQSELESYRRKVAATSSIKPGKRGKQLLATRSNLRSMVTFYELWIMSVTGATVAGKTWSDDEKAAFLATIDPLVKRAVVQRLVAAIDEALSD